MKKLFHEEKWKRRLAAASKRELSKRTRQTSTRKRTSLPVHTKRRQIRPVKRHGRIEIAAPAQFDLQNNSEETLSFCNEIYHYVMTQRNLYVDLTKVEQLSTEVLAYMLSMMEYAKIDGHRCVISGNSPKEPTCNELFRKSGFYKYVFSTPGGALVNRWVKRN